MSNSNLATDVEAGLHETQNQRDARVEELWVKLDPKRTGELDFKGLQRGFKKIDHPMKNADDMLKKILSEVDTNGDGKIQYEEFRTFVGQAERQLLLLFKAIDKDGNGKLDMKELQAAFKNAKLTVSSGRLNDFFNDMDMNNDGYVSFDEWRDFLLFMPAGGYDSKLRAVLTYYNSVAHVTPEGDSLVSEDTLQGLGTVGSLRSLSQSLFGSLLRVAYPAGLPTQHPPSPPPPSIPAANSAANTQMDAALSTETTSDGRAVVTGGVGAEEPERKRRRIGEATTRQTAATSETTHIQQTSQDSQTDDDLSGAPEIDQRSLKTKLYALTEFVPDPGYFIAGAIAGGVSRTATAPLDRLKVYLLVNTKSETDTAVRALKSGRPINAVKNATRPLGDAVRDLYRSGGFRSFFAGNGLNVLKIMPESAIKFGSYEAAKRALANFEGHGDAQRLTGWSKFTAGGVAGMVAQFCVYPLDTLKFRLQCETVEGGLKGSALVRQTAAKMYADGGVRAAYRGVTMGLIGMFPYSAIDMGMFEFLKKTYRTYYARYSGCHEDDANPGNVATGIIGASSGAFGASVVYPLNVVRTRLQTQGTVMHPPTYTGIWDVTTKTVQKEGWRGLYKGLTPNLLKVAPALSITWVVYENSKRLLSLH